MRFEDTRWSVVLRAGSADDTAREAMESLCKSYWPSLYSFLRARGYSKDDASDLLQGFFLALLEKEWVSRARPEAGRFRTFLLTALIRYISNDSAKNRALKRGGKIGFVFIDSDDAEHLHQRIPSNTQSPEEIFDRQWAHGILQRALDLLGQSYREAGKVELFEELSPLMAAPGMESGYLAASKKLGMTLGAIRVAAHRMRARYRETISFIVAETVESLDDVEDEIRYLIQALGGQSGRNV